MHTTYTAVLSIQTKYFPEGNQRVFERFLCLTVDALAFQYRAPYGWIYMGEIEDIHGYDILMSLLDNSENGIVLLRLSLEKFAEDLDFYGIFDEKLKNFESAHYEKYKRQGYHATNYKQTTA